LSPQQALETLGLAPSAGAEDIRQAYRDLVKVWHPDRFGSDLRLRSKAEEKLKALNVAFSTLESADFKIAHDSSPAPQPVTVEYSPSDPRPRASRDRVVRGWLYLAALMLIAAMAAFAVHSIGTHKSRPALPVPQEPSAADDASIRKASRKPHTTTAASPTPAFKVWSLSASDTDRLQLACASHTPGSQSYRDCIAAQLDALTQPRGTPSLTGMSTGERNAAQSACRTAKAAGDAPYTQCLRRQLAELAAEPIRPDLSTFDAVDRSSIQTACSAASRRGAAEYDRCLVRFAKTLSDAQPASSPTP
jgi:hypothetical protein